MMPISVPKAQVFHLRFFFFFFSYFFILYLYKELVTVNDLAFCFFFFNFEKSGHH